MKFAVVGEGKTDFIVIRNTLIGYFNDKNLPINRLLPKEDEPVGWSNVFKYLSTEEFKGAFEANDYIIIQIDTNECHDWNESMTHIGDNLEQVETFINQIKNVLVNKIGREFYESNKHKIIFAITIHEIECWLLPFNTDKRAHVSKIVNCSNTLESIAQTRGFSISQKHYRDGKNYDDLSKEMKKNATLMERGELNPSLKYFLDLLNSFFPRKIETEENIVVAE
ncbi:MAG: hypothetical protein ACXVCE_17235 [Bacteriovorax sp.]